MGGKNLGDRTAPQASGSVAVVIPCHNGARFLGEALGSVRAQSVRPQQVIVVDDGSHDDPASVVRAFAGVEIVHQANLGPSAARNRGLHACSSDYVVFLDADDRLAPDAIERGLQCHSDNPGCGFVYGAHRRVDPALAPLGPPVYRPCAGSAFDQLLGGNMIGSCPAVMFDRAKLIECGGFDPDVRACEDYDVYLKVARRYPAASHPAVVADYRIHPGSTAPGAAGMLAWAYTVLDRHRPPAHDGPRTAAYRRGRRRWGLVYAHAAWRGEGAAGMRWEIARQAPLASLIAISGLAARRMLPRRAFQRLRGLWLPKPIPVGGVSMGDLARAKPVSASFGFDRGTPVDRWYIERFLARHAADIRGRALEVADDGYCRRFGTGVTRQDVLNVSAEMPGATIGGDLAQRGTLPEGAFDCLVMTQVLQLIYDMPAAVEEMKRALAPGGVLLLTVPGVTSIDPSEWDGSWYWSLTKQAAERLFGEAFGADNVEVWGHGNVYAATCFLQGLAVQEIDESLLKLDDPAYPMLVCVRARRGG